MMRPRFRVGYPFWAMEIPGRSKQNEQYFLCLFILIFYFHAFKCELNLDSEEWVNANTNYRNDSRLVYFMTAYY